MSDADRYSDTAARLRLRSALAWTEHCTECAAPACYSACAFYTPRLDGHCRRFENGIEPVPGLPGGRRIRFRKWGKLEAEGPARLLPAAEAAGVVAPSEPVGPFAVLNRRRAWREAMAYRDASLGEIAGADAFIIEGRLLSPGPRAFTLTVVPLDKGAPGLFQTRFTLDRSWSMIPVALTDIGRLVDLSRPHLVQVEPVGDAAGVDVVFGHLEFVSWAEGCAPEIAEPSVKPAKKAKVVVWDLDHTVWDGILLEDGKDGVRLRDGVRETMAALDERGVLQSVASKNNPGEAMAALSHHGIAEFMLAPQIGWGPKSASLKRLADILNLGLDSFVFLDDQPFERGEVSEALPMVTVLDEKAVDGLLARDQFDLPVTAESRKRRSLYRVEAERAAAAEASGDDYDAFLRTCDLTLSVAPLGPEDAVRVFELSQRTNQLNVAASRFERADVEAMIDAADGREAWTLRCADRFGDYGLIGFCAVRPETGEITDFFMSCRVQRKRVEAAFFAWLSARCEAPLSVHWKKAARNAPAVEMFEGLGFVLHDQGGHGILTRPPGAGFEGADIVRIVIAEPARIAEYAE